MAILHLYLRIERWPCSQAVHYTILDYTVTIPHPAVIFVFSRCCRCHLRRPHPACTGPQLQKVHSRMAAFYGHHAGEPTEKSHRAAVKERHIGNALAKMGASHESRVMCFFRTFFAMTWCGEPPHCPMHALFNHIQPLKCKIYPHFPSHAIWQKSLNCDIS